LVARMSKNGSCRSSRSELGARPIARSAPNAQEISSTYIIISFTPSFGPYVIRGHENIISQRLKSDILVAFCLVLRLQDQISIISTFKNLQIGR